MSNYCNEMLRKKGAPYPRTCQECGLGPCKREIKAKEQTDLAVIWREISDLNAPLVDPLSVFRIALFDLHRRLEEIESQPDEWSGDFSDADEN